MPCFDADKIVNSDFSLHESELKLEFTMHKFTKALAAIGLAAVMSQSAMAENLKLGFLVKQPEEPWFQTEWKFADKAGKDLGFDVIKIAVPDGEKTLNAIDSLAASGAKVRGRDLPQKGKQVLIWMEGLDVLGSVAWAKGGQCGVRFDYSLEVEAMACLEAQAVSTVFAH